MYLDLGHFPVWFLPSIIFLLAVWDVLVTQKRMNHAKKNETRFHRIWSRSLAVYPQQDSNLRFWLRRPTLYPLSYGGGTSEVYHTCPLLAISAQRRRCAVDYSR